MTWLAAYHPIVPILTALYYLYRILTDRRHH
jgi:membrane protein CcdC involved in cytochrome C biogenesis